MCVARLKLRDYFAGKMGTQPDVQEQKVLISLQRNQNLIAQLVLLANDKPIVIHYMSIP